MFSLFLFWWPLGVRGNQGSLKHPSLSGSFGFWSSCSGELDLQWDFWSRSLPCLSFPHDYIDVFSAIKELLSSGLRLAGIRNLFLGNHCLTLSGNTACLS